MYNFVDGYEKPREVLKYCDAEVCEMSDAQLDFLCGLIRDNKPKKLLEVGVAEGGTSAVVLNCLQMVCPDCEMYSVDLNERLYRNEKYKTGYVLTELSSYLKMDNHHLLTGGILPDFIYEIGSGIDFVILDTVHRLPGEILDFLCVLPFLSENAVVVLHDITMGTSYLRGTNDAISNGVLFFAISGNKFWMPDRNGHFGTANIAAFEVEQKTKELIAEIFGTLMLPWAYMPLENELEKYRKVFIDYYDDECNALFEYSIYSNAKAQKIADKKYLYEEWSDLCRKIQGKEIFVFGAGKYAKRLTEKLKREKMYVQGYVVSDIMCADDTCISRSEYAEMIKSIDNTVLLYAIKSDEAYYQLAELGIPVIYVPKGWMEI